MNQLGRHSFNMDALMGKDLDQLAEVMTGTLREADVKQHASGARPGPGAASGVTEGNRESLASTALNQEQRLKSDEEQGVHQKDPLGLRQQGRSVFCPDESQR